MNREIKFRGMTTSGEWKYGSLLQSEIAANGYCLCEIHERFADSFSIAKHEVKPESVGQYTGLKDKNGKEIYEGDVVEYSVWDGGENPRSGQVWYKDAAFLIGEEGELLHLLYPTCEVIGNIYSNAELLTTSKL